MREICISLGRYVSRCVYRVVWYEHACERERRTESCGQAEPPRVEGAEREEERDLLAVLVAKLVELVRL